LARKLNSPRPLLIPRPAACNKNLILDKYSGASGEGCCLDVFFLGSETEASESEFQIARNGHCDEFMKVRFALQLGLEVSGPKPKCLPDKYEDAWFDFNDDGAEDEDGVDLLADLAD